MKSIAIIILGLIIFSFFLSCDIGDDESISEKVYGCMDFDANNYNSDATEDDGSCEYCNWGSSFILLSTDGGMNWDIRCLQENIGQVTDISMVDSNNIWICTRPNSTVSVAQIMHTVDGGITWEEQYFVESIDPSGLSFDYIEMFDINNGIAEVSKSWSLSLIPLFLKTTDGGQTWERTTTEAIGIPGDHWRRVDFIDINTGYLYESGINPQKLYKTQNSGMSWIETNFEGYAQVMRFFNEYIGLIVQGDSIIHRTVDGGLNWEQINTQHTGWGLDIEFDPFDPSRVWMLSGGGLFFSNDTGSTWAYCMDNTHYGADALCVSGSSLWAYYYNTRYLNNVNTEDCESHVEHILPEYIYGVLNLGYDFDVVGNIIVVPGSFSN